MQAIVGGRSHVLLLTLLLLSLSCAVCSEYVFAQSASWSGGVWEYGGMYRDGIRAAFLEANLKGGVRNQTLRLVSYDDVYTVSNALANMDRLLAENPNLLAYVGFTGSSIAVAAIERAATLRIPFIAPYTGTFAIRGTFNPYVVHIRPGYNDEALFMLRVLLEVKHLTRIALVYQNDSFGIPSMQSVVAALASVKMSLTNLLVYNSATIATTDWVSRCQEMWATRPQGVILFAVFAAAKPILTAFKSITSESVVMVGGTYMSDAVKDYYRSTNDATAPNYYQTQVLPDPESSSAVATKYRAAITAYDGRTNYDYVSLEGYVAGRFLIEALWRAREATRAALLDAIFTTRMFDVEELLLGPFSNTCPTGDNASLSRGSLCNCNQGLRYTSISSINTSRWTWETKLASTYDITQCFCPIKSVQVPTAIASVRLSPLIAGGDVINTKLEAAVVAASQSMPYFEEIAIRPDDSNTSSTRIRALGNRTRLFAVLGGMYLEPQADYPVFPVYSIPSLPAGATFSRTTVRILSTMQQELLVAAKYLSTALNRTSFHLLMRSSYQPLVKADILTATASSLATFGGSLSSTQTFNDDVSLSASLATLPPRATVLLIGVVGETEVTALTAFVSSSPTLSVFLPFSDVVLYWDLLSQVCPNGTAVCPVYFSTNLPNWMNPSTSTFVTNYHAAIASDARLHPGSVVGYLFARFMDYVISRSGDADPSRFLTTLYSSSVVALDDLTLGPFVDVACAGVDCLCNLGARTLRVYTVSAIKSGLAPLGSVHFPSCKVEYVIPAGKGSSVTLIVSLCIILPVLVIGGATALYLSRKGRDNSCAPTDATKPFAVVFTDIESSTALWGRYPTVMAKAIDEHHAIIRSEIRKHDLYEVKTIGDSFMCVAKSPEDALQFALDVQLQLYRHDWGTRAIDEHYLNGNAHLMNLQRKKCRSSFTSHTGSTPKHQNGGSQLALALPTVTTSGSLSARRNSVSKHNSPRNPSKNPSDGTIELPAPENITLQTLDTSYENIWNGLRVRIGLNYACGEIRLDSTTGGYDYYGPVVNEAARIEAVAHGGQIITPAEIISAAPSVKDYAITQLGMQSLRGVDRPVALVQVEPTLLNGRKFPALRLDAIAKDLDIGSQSSDTHTTSNKYEQQSATTSSSSKHCVDDVVIELAAGHSLVAAGLIPAANMREELLRFKSVINSLFAPTAAEFRFRTATTLCENWRVHTRHSLKDPSAYEIALYRLAARVAETAEVLDTLRTLPPDGDVDVVESFRS